jgi:hypothetical protein
MKPTTMADAWLRRFGALHDLALRVDYARHELGRLTPDTLLELMTELAAGADAGGVAHRDLLQTLFVALAAPELGPLRRAAAARARERNALEVASMLEARGEARGPELEAKMIPDLRLGRAPTLGERKSLARTRDRQLIARVLRDPHPDVIRILLTNPRLTEDDAVRLCASRPIDPAVLRQVFVQPRWSSRYRVRVALVKNPCCPTDVAVQLASRLRREDARAVAASQELEPSVRRAALRVRRGRTLH